MDTPTRWEDTEKGKACARDKGNLENFQRRIFNLTNPGKDETLLDLLRERDQLSAKMSIHLTLLRIYSEYQSFLSENSHIAGTEINNPEGTQGLFDQLNELQRFMADNQEPVERFHVVSEVLETLGEEKLAEIRQAGNDQQKFEAIKAALVERCSDSSNSSLYICGVEGGLENSLQFITNNETVDRKGFVNKFANVLADLDSFGDVNNFSSLFVDNSRDLDAIGDVNFVEHFNTLVSKSKEECRAAILIGNDSVQACLEKSFTDLTPEQSAMIRRLEGISPNGGSITNLSQLVSSYVGVAKKTKEIHDEVNGGTISDLMRVAQISRNNSRDWQGDLQRAEQELTKPGVIQGYRERFKNLTKGHFAKLGAFLSQGDFGYNTELFNKFNDQKADSLELTQGANQDNAQYANQLIKNVMCATGDTECTDAQFRPFKMQNGKMEVDQDAIINVFNQMMKQTNGGEDIHNILFGGRDALAQKLSNIETQISNIRASGDYKRLNAFKDFIWQKVVDNCQRKVNGQDYVERIAALDSCKLSSMVQTGLNNFLKVGDELLAYQHKEDRVANLTQLSEYCNEIHNSDREFYNSQLSQTQICPTIFEDHRVETRQNIVQTEVARQQQRRKLDKNAIYEYDSRGKIVDVYRPKSNMSLFLPQLAYTVNEQLPFYLVQRPGMKMQVEQWRAAGKAQKTQQAFWEAQRQSWLNNTRCGAFGCFYNTTVLETASPTFGQTAFGFGSTSTVPTVNSTGFGF